MTEKLDSTDWALLAELQRDGRITMTDLARRVNLGTTATADRVRRLEAAGVITGYSARVDLAKIGLPVLAMVRLSRPTKGHEQFGRLLEKRAEILECQRVTGEDCYVLKVSAESTAHLEALIDELADFGHATTSVVYSETLPYRGPWTTRTLPTRTSSTE
jgi:Lrp/AsnC family leucine-responsive transcriptional regulator